MADSFTWQSLDGWYDQGAARYLAHFRQQIAAGQFDRAGCSLRKAAYKARQARALREGPRVRGYLYDHTVNLSTPFYASLDAKP